MSALKILLPPPDSICLKTHSWHWPLLFHLPFYYLPIFAIPWPGKKKHKKTLTEKNEEIQSQNELITLSNNKLSAVKLIIEQKNLELNAKVKERTTELVKTNEELQSFLYRSSHDIQGPLTTLKGLCQLATIEIKDKSTLGFIYMINDTTDKLLGTVKSINNIYQIKNKEIEIKRVEIDPLVQQVAMQFGKELKDKGIHLIKEMPGNLVARVDQDFVSIAISEIVKNSIQFNSILNIENPYIKITGQKADKHITLHIEDNGIGISPHAKNVIFDMFKRGSEHSKGIGLGLYAAKSALKRINGSISLVENERATTCFSITIPAA